MPLRLLDAEPRDSWPSPGRHALLPVRCDTHGVWRGDAVAQRSDALVRRLCGVPVEFARPRGLRRIGGPFRRPVG